MFGLNDGMMKLLLSGAKKQIKAKGVKFIAIKANDENEDLNVRAFTDPMYIITNGMFEEIEKLSPGLSLRIKHINNPDAETKTTENKD